MQVFLFTPLVTCYLKKYLFCLHLLFSILLMSMTLTRVYRLHNVCGLVGVASFC
ncbi:hypothetical protein Hanom_Chr14g01274051 [Helianthus anomalus]